MQIAKETGEIRRAMFAAHLDLGVDYQNSNTLNIPTLKNDNSSQLEDNVFSTTTTTNTTKSGLTVNQDINFQYSKFKEQKYNPTFVQKIKEESIIKLQES